MHPLHEIVNSRLMAVPMRRRLRLPEAGHAGDGLRILRRQTLDDGHPRQRSAVDAEVREGCLTKNPPRPPQHRVEKAKVFVEVRDELLTPSGKPSERSSRSGLKLRENPLLDFAPERGGRGLAAAGYAGLPGTSEPALSRVRAGRAFPDGSIQEFGSTGWTNAGISDQVKCGPDPSKVGR